jgi:Fe-S-cluster containining protein
MVSPTKINACQRCGTCCQKGGPALHLDDKPLVDRGIISASCLYTLRCGELVRDLVTDRLVELPTELIKLKGQKESWTCTFFESGDARCQIYKDRPLECRALKCWDTADFEKIYRSDRLARRDLLEEMAGLWELIFDHEARCAYSTIKQLVSQLADSDREAALQKIIETVRYDMEIRNLVIEKGSLDSGMTDFLFGRPLMQTMTMFGIKIEKHDDSYKVIKSGKDYTAVQ